MADPRPNHQALFHRCAEQRFEEAQVLRRANKTTGAVYLAGYGVECILKALVLSATPASQATDVMDLFRGRRGHDFEWLRTRYREQGGAGPPKEVTRQFLLVSGWSTNLRYLPRTYQVPEADRFLAATLAILTWAKGRL